MSLTISKDYTCFLASAPSSVVSPYRGEGPVAWCSNATDGREDDAVQLSPEGRSLAASGLLKNLILPTEANVRQLTATLSKELRSFLRESGVSTQYPIEFSVGRNGDIQIEGDRADKENVLERINSNESIKTQIRNVAAISSHAAGMAEGLKFQKEYLATNNPASVVAKYSYLFGPHQQFHSISVLFDGHDVQVMSDGKQWISTIS